MLKKSTKATACLKLVGASEKRRATSSHARKLTFLGAEGYDVYNISAEFRCKGKLYIAGRVEQRGNEMSMVRFFEKTAPDTYTAVLPEMTFRHLQDPFVTRVQGQLVMGGVQIILDPLDEKRIISWHTCFYRGKDLASLKLFAVGPAHMKDIRLGNTPDGKVAILTRPQGKKGGRGCIGYKVIDKLTDLNPDEILEANIFHDHFLRAEWGGANDVHLLKNGMLGVLGHIARRDEAGLHYQAMAFAVDPADGTHTALKVIACRKDLPDGDSKRPDLVDVMFSGGLVRHGNGRATLYAGLSDCEAGRIEIDDPFIEYEK